MKDRPSAEATTLAVTAWVAGALLALGLPLAHFLIASQYARGALDARAEAGAQEVTRLVIANPTMWVYEQVRLGELLERRAASGEPETRRLLDATGRVVAERSQPLDPPLLVGRHAILDRTGPAAYLEVERSLRPILLRSGATLLASLLATALLLLAVHRLPARAARQAQLARAESERRYESLYQTMREGLAVLRVERDAQGRATALRLLDVNPAAARMLGLERSRLAGLDPAQGAAGPLTELLPQLLAQAEGGAPVSAEVATEQGARAFRVSSFSPGDGLLAALLEDVTAERRLREQLGHAQRIQALGQLAGGVAHDFNNLLTVILAHSGLLAETLQGPAQEEAQAIETTARRAAGLTRQLLAFSRRQPIRPEVLAVAEVVAGLEQLIGRLLGRGVMLACEVAADVGCVLMDRSMLDQVLVNLAVNARDAMPQGGQLLLSARAAPGEPAAGGAAAGRWVILSVTDTGTGMDEATRRRAFEPFFTTKPVGQGTGLGLASVLRAVQEAGGTVAVDSEPGRGTTVTVHLPQVEAPAAPAPAVERPGATLPRGPRRLLVVDDEPGVRQALRRFLEWGGHEVVEAGGGEEALATLQASGRPFDLVITDVAMPGMDGWALGRALQDLGPLPVIYVSGAHHAPAAAQAQALQPWFLAKPFQRHELLALVQAALGPDPVTLP